jgi:hypothetical protein
MQTNDIQFGSMPSLSAYLDDKLIGVEVVPGKVTDEDGHIFANFSLPIDMVKKLAPEELFKGYIAPLLCEMAGRINKMGKVCTRAIPLPDKDSKVIGFRCWRGRIPVNLYIMRRPDPDRQQMIIDLHVQKVEADNGEE